MTGIHHFGSDEPIRHVPQPPTPGRFARGGVIPSGLVQVTNTTGYPERVLTHDQVVTVFRDASAVLVAWWRKQRPLFAYLARISRPVIHAHRAHLTAMHTAYHGPRRNRRRRARRR
jgi:hypothetical protein